MFPHHSQKKMSDNLSEQIRHVRETLSTQVHINNNINTISEKLPFLLNQTRTLKTILSQTRTDLQNCYAEGRKLQQSYDELKNQAEFFENKIKTLEEQKGSLEQNLLQLQNSNNEANNAEINWLKTEKEDLEKQIRQCRENEEAIKSELDSLNETREELSETQPDTSLIQQKTDEIRQLINELQRIPSQSASDFASAEGASGFSDTNPSGAASSASTNVPTYSSSAVSAEPRSTTQGGDTIDVYVGDIRTSINKDTVRSLFRPVGEEETINDIRVLNVIEEPRVFYARDRNQWIQVFGVSDINNDPQPRILVATKDRTPTAIVPRKLFSCLKNKIAKNAVIGFVKSEQKCFDDDKKIRWNSDKKQNEIQVQGRILTLYRDRKKEGECDLSHYT